MNELEALKKKTEKQQKKIATLTDQIEKLQKVVGDSLESRMRADAKNAKDGDENEFEYIKKLVRAYYDLQQPRIMHNNRIKGMIRNEVYDADEAARFHGDLTLELLETAETIWNEFERKFLDLWRTQDGAGKPSFTGRDLDGASRVRRRHDAGGVLGFDNRDRRQRGRNGRWAGQCGFQPGRLRFARSDGLRARSLGRLERRVDAGRGREPRCSRAVAAGERGDRRDDGVARRRASARRARGIRGGA